MEVLKALGILEEFNDVFVDNGYSFSFEFKVTDDKTKLEKVFKMILVNKLETHTIHRSNISDDTYVSGIHYIMVHIEENTL